METVRNLVYGPQWEERSLRMAQRKQPVIPNPWVDPRLGEADPKTTVDQDGRLDALKKALAERALNAAMRYPLATGQVDGHANSRNGSSRTRFLRLLLSPARARLTAIGGWRCQLGLPGRDDRLSSASWRCR
jgi:putative transposase